MGTAAERYREVSPARWLDADGRALGFQVHEARAWERALGLMGVGVVEQGFGLLIDRCRSIHMFFMAVPIDAVWVGPALPGGRRRVMGVARRLAPGRLAFAPKGAVGVIEVRAGTCPDDAVYVECGAVR